MKNFFKKVAFVLALAMVITNIAPALSASAAAAPSLKYKSKVLYVGGSAFDEYTDNCWTPSQNTDGYQVTYKVTTGEDLITVASNGKITTTNNGIGKAVVTVTYTKDGAPTVTEKFTVKVRRNSTDVRLVNAVQTQVAETLTLGQEITLKSAKSFVGTSYKKGNYGLNNYMTLVSDQITYKVSDDKVIKVEDGKLTAVGAGTATLTVVAFEYGDKTQTPVNTKDYTITVAAEGMISVTQKTHNKLEVVLGVEPTETPKTSDFTITNNASKADFAVKEVKVEKNVATLTTFSSMNDGETYTVVYGDKELTFTATDNNVADIALNRDTVPYETETKLTMNLLDKNGVVLEEVEYDAEMDHEGTKTFEIETTKGYTSESKLYLFAKGDTAKVKIAFGTGEYDNKGNEIGYIEKNITVTAVDKTPVVKGSVKYTVVNNADENEEVNWDDFTANTLTAVDDDVRLYAYAVDSEDVDLTQEAGYSYESSNDDMLIVTSDTSMDKGVVIGLSPIKAGTAYVIIKDSDDKIVDTLQVVIRAKRNFNTFELEKSSIVISTAQKTEKIKVTLYDQYGEKLDSSYTVPEIEDNDGVLELAMDGTNFDGKIEVNANNESIGKGKSETRKYKITVDEDDKKVSKTLTVKIQEPNTDKTPTYKLILSDSKVDTKVSNDDTKSVKIDLVKLFDGVIGEYVDIDDATEVVVKRGSTTLKTADSDYSIASKQIVVPIKTLGSVSGTSISGSAVAKIDKADTGSYSVKVVYAGKTLSGGFTVTDSQLAMKVVPTSTSTDKNVEIEKIVRETMKFYYDGKEVDDEDVYVKSVELSYTNDSTENKEPAGLDITNATKITFKKVTVLYKVAEDDGVDVYAEYTLNVSKTINLK